MKGEELLSDHILEEATISCDKCGFESKLDAYEPEKQFYALGWRVKKGRCLCPACLKIK